MKRKTNILLAVFLLFFLIPQTIFPQESSLCEFIGKNINTVIGKYGKPLHHDKSNPAMECVFYQSKSSRMAFIGDKTGVYQIQVDFYYNSEKEAKNSINDFLRDCGKKELSVDTLNTGDFKIYGPGVKMNLTLFENTFSKKYEVKFKADKSESK